MSGPHRLAGGSVNRLPTGEDRTLYETVLQIKIPIIGILIFIIRFMIYVILFHKQPPFQTLIFPVTMFSVIQRNNRNGKPLSAHTNSIAFSCPPLYNKNSFSRETNVAAQLDMLQDKEDNI